MSIMMVLDYLNEALKKKGESSDNNGSFLYYEDVLKKLSTEVKSWTFISKGNAKYEFEDCDSAVFFLSYVWNLIQLYGTDLDFWVVWMPGTGNFGCGLCNSYCQSDGIRNG